MSKLLSVSIPDDLKAALESLAREQGTTLSEVVRQALRAHLWEGEFGEVQAYGIRKAEEFGIGPDDVERLVDEVRADVRTAARR